MASEILSIGSVEVNSCQNQKSYDDPSFLSSSDRHDKQLSARQFDGGVDLSSAKSILGTN